MKTRILMLYVIVLFLSMTPAQTCLAIEVDGPFFSGPPYNWFYQDRASWQSASRNMAGKDLTAFIANNGRSNTFMQAAAYNTQYNRPDEYLTISQRHDYYDFIAAIIQYDPSISSGLKDIRFFDAAALVIRSPGVGTIEAPIAHECKNISSSTRDLLETINKKLFEKNVGILQKLLFSWKEPRDPNMSPTTIAITAFDYDLAMVEFEQSQLQIILNEQSPPSATVNEINSFLTDLHCLFKVINVDVPSPFPKDPWLKWAQAYVQEQFTRSLDFATQRDRVAIGKAAIFWLHRKSEDDYKKYISNNYSSSVAPAAPINLRTLQ